MAMRAPRVCGCGVLVAYGVKCRCQLARAGESKACHDALRPNATERGYGSKWRQARADFLAKPENKYCACGCGRLADMVDHIEPHRRDWKKFWDRRNWQPLASSPCHSSRKQRQEKRKQP